MYVITTNDFFVVLSCRISVENIEMEFSSLYVRIKSLEEKIQGDQELLLQLEPFLQVRQLLRNTAGPKPQLTEVLQMIISINVCV